MKITKIPYTNAPYKRGPNKGVSTKGVRVTAPDCYTISACETIGCKTWAVVYGSTGIYEGLAKVTAIGAAVHVVKSGADTMDSMRTAAKEYLDGLA